MRPSVEQQAYEQCNTILYRHERALGYRSGLSCLSSQIHVITLKISADRCTYHCLMDYGNATRIYGGRDLIDPRTISIILPHQPTLGSLTCVIRVAAKLL
jgi:hypothetical protein